MVVLLAERRYRLPYPDLHRRQVVALRRRIVVVVVVVRMMEEEYTEHLGCILAADRNNPDLVVELHTQRLSEVLMPIRSWDMDSYQRYVCGEQ